MSDPYFEGSEEVFGGPEPQPGDRGTCSRCGDEITLETKIHIDLQAPSAGSGAGKAVTNTLQWKHVDRGRWDGFRFVGHDHMAVLGGPA